MGTSLGSSGLVFCGRPSDHETGCVHLITATPLSSTYASTKHALHGYFDSLRAEVADRGIRVTIACPGPVVSEIGRHAIVHNAGQDYDIQSSQKRMPTKRCAELMSRGGSAGSCTTQPHPA